MKPYYQSGDITIYHGDCRDIMLLKENGCIVTDPPYGIALKNHGAARNGKRHAKEIGIKGDATTDLGQYVLDSARISGALTIAFASPWKPWAGEWRNLICWDKGGAVGGGGDVELCLKRTWELIQIANNDILTARLPSVWYEPMLPTDSALHPAQKPLSLMQKLLRVFCSRNICVIDPFMGSGTTLRAAKDLGLKAIGIELEEKYCEIAAKRLQQEVFDFGNPQ